jgi:putative FmdB family regulatory protein
VPTYQYACTTCGHEFEAVQSFSDAALTDCPECAGRLRKVFSAVGVLFKGSGFYRTDSRAAAKAVDGSAAAPDGEGGKGGKGGKGKSASTQSTPAAAASSGGSSTTASSTTSGAA